MDYDPPEMKAVGNARDLFARVEDCRDEGDDTMAPKIVGLIKMEYPRIKRNVDKDLPAGTQEKISHVGFDTDGQAWGLVERFTPIEEDQATVHVKHGSAPAFSRTMTMGRMDFNRWVRFDAIPFDETERVTADVWGL